MIRANKLVLAHIWVAFGAFAAAILLGAWQMWVRSPFAAPLSTPANYYAAVTAHGSIMGYVLTTFFIMGFGYFVAETSLHRPVPGQRFAWLAYFTALFGTILVAVTVLTGRASVMFTFYPPLTASPVFYLGLVLVVVGSWVWCASITARAKICNENGHIL